MAERLRVGRLIQQRLGTDREILYCQHHLAHAASAFFVSPFEEAALITADGVGEWTTTAWGAGRGTEIKTREEMRFPHSIGLLFSAVTAYLGFRVNDAEWKVMGLAPYGNPRYLEKFKQVIDLRDDGSFRLNMRYFSFPHSTRRTFSRAWEDLFGRPARSREQALDEFHADIAASGQRLIEEIMLRIARHVRGKTGSRRLCLAGGVGLNCVANWRMLTEVGFDDVFVQPAAGDSGGALGAASYLWHAVLGKPRGYVMRNALLGPEYTSNQVRETLDRNGAKYATCVTNEDLVERTASLLAEGKVIAWFQGRMEYGPRALGSRSILADPRNPQMKDIINSKVKFRESFRPFAPAVLAAAAREYFELPAGIDSPFMLLTPPVRPEKRDLIPAVTHQDGSARVQTVTRESNPLFHELISAFGRVTGVPILVNTSFNVRGEPIVCTPQDAYNTFINTGIDALIIGPYVLTEKPAQVDLEGGLQRSEALEATTIGE